MKEEIMDIVDLNDVVVGQATQDEVYARLLPHRIVHVLIFNKKGEMAMQLRSKQKSFCPLHWVTTVGGHVQTGESYEQAAAREMKEEVGVELPMEFFAKDFYNDNRNLQKFLVTYKSVYEGPFTVNPEEVERVDFFPMEKVQDMIQDGEKFHPELLFLLMRHFVK